ncbi:MAG: hypothetical protein ABI893_00335 [Polaromonas sp.]
MLALPMQGFASASMQYCGKSVDHTALQASVEPETHHRHADASNDGHDHTMHGEATQAASAEQTPDLQNQLPDAAHKCGVCASCCNLVGMTAATQTVVIHSAPNAVYIEHSILIQSVPSGLPEKPPRA